MQLSNKLSNCHSVARESEGDRASNEHSAVLGARVKAHIYKYRT